MKFIIFVSVELINNLVIIYNTCSVVSTCNIHVRDSPGIMDSPTCYAHIVKQYKIHTYA